MPKKNKDLEGSKGQKGDSPDQGSVLNQVAQEVKQDLKTTPQEVTDALMRDAKQAVNYEIRKGFRSIINGIFKK